MKKLLIAIAAVLLMVVIAKAQPSTVVVVVTPEQASTLRIMYDNYRDALADFEKLRGRVLLANEAELVEATNGKADKYEWQYGHSFKVIIGYKNLPGGNYFPDETPYNKAEELFIVPKLRKEEKGKAPPKPIKVPEKMVARK